MATEIPPRDRTSGSATAYNFGMSVLRRHRFATVLFALCALLFMQFALAGLPCARLAPQARVMAPVAQAGAPCAQHMAFGMDETQPPLCHAHCQSEQAAGDAPPLLVPMALVDHRMFFAVLEPVVASEGAAPQAPLLARATAPPLSIRHCCWRI